MSSTKTRVKLKATHTPPKTANAQRKRTYPQSKRVNIQPKRTQPKREYSQSKKANIQPKRVNNQRQNTPNLAKEGLNPVNEERSQKGVLLLIAIGLSLILVSSVILVLKAAMETKILSAYQNSVSNQLQTIEAHRIQNPAMATYGFTFPLTDGI